LPIKIIFLDQLNLPYAVPLLQLLLALDGIAWRFVRLDIDKSKYLVLANEPGAEALPVLFDPLRQVVRDTNV
jgi:hypothetical protein